MPGSDNSEKIVKDIQFNCDISDARDHGIYSMCTMVLKLRNLYKWEHGVEPWKEAEPADLLDWIDRKEEYWESIVHESFRNLGLNGHHYSPESLVEINQVIAPDNLIYGAGYGRSMKAVFFVAEKIEERRVAHCPVVILGKEIAREMSSPFAMAQDGMIYIRREALRYFLWDQIQELRSSCRVPFRHALKLYGLLKDDELDQKGLRDKLDLIVDEELNLFIYHEVGEILQTTFNSLTMEKIIKKFPGSVIEFVCRTLKDVLADTHPEGVLAYIIKEQRHSSLSFYIGFLDGLRKHFFSEITELWSLFCEENDWQYIEDARLQCRQRMTEIAEKVERISAKIDNDPDDFVENLFFTEIISPLGLDIPQKQ